MSTLITLIGDATLPTLKPNQIAIIPHVTNNCSGGVGFFAAVEKRWPGTQAKYCKWVQKELAPAALGLVQFIKPVRGGQIVLANMCAQDNDFTTRNRHLPPLRYSALVDCMKKVYDKSRSIEIESMIARNHNKSAQKVEVVIHAPRFGSGIAGGDERVIEQLMYEIWVNKGIDVVVYDFVTPTPKYPDSDAELLSNFKSMSDDDKALDMFKEMTKSRRQGDRLRIKLPEISHENNRDTLFEKSW